jgi:hypothetical protein
MKCIDSTSLNGEVDCTVPSHLKGNWFVRLLFALIKVSAGLKQGFGYEQFITDIRVLTKNDDLSGLLSKYNITKAQIIRAGNTDSFRRKFIDWVSGLNETKLQDWHYDLIGYVLCNRINTISKNSINNYIDKVTDFIRYTTYEDRIAPYPHFAPLRSMIELALEEKGISYEYHPRFKSLVSKLSDSTSGPGTTSVIMIGNILIHWKSAHEGNTGHKTKELCGRGFSLRYSLSKRKKALELNKSIDKLFLVLDGDFTAQNIKHLITLGWDKVYNATRLDDCITDIIKSTRLL